MIRTSPIRWLPPSIRSRRPKIGFLQARSVVSLAYDKFGPPQQQQKRDELGTPILFLHGLFGSARNNRAMSKVLAKDLNRTVYALDLRNHGNSPHDLAHDYMAMAEDVEHFVDEHELGKVSLIGHSMGAKVAMTLALSSPDLIESLVSVDNAPVDVALQSDFAKYIRGMQEIERSQVGTANLADKILSNVEESLPIRQFLLTNLIRNDTGHLKFRIPLNILEKALGNMGDFPFKDPDVVRFEKPTLFVRGTKSKYVADETLPVIGQFFPKFVLQDIDAGHWVISENPQAFQEAVEEFLQKSE